MPPVLLLALATPVYNLTHLAFRQYGWHVCTNLFAGGLFGYICYDLTHYFLHHKNLPAWWRDLKKYHLQHHFMDYQVGFGVTSRFWDRVFGTELIYKEDRERLERERVEREDWYSGPVIVCHLKVYASPEP